MENNYTIKHSFSRGRNPSRWPTKRGGPVSQTADLPQGGEGEGFLTAENRLKFQVRGRGYESFIPFEAGVRLFISPEWNRSIERKSLGSLGLGKDSKKKIWMGEEPVPVMKFLEGEGTMPGIIFGPVPTVLSIGQSQLVSLVGGTSFSLSPSKSYRPCHTSFYAPREMNAVERR